MEFKQRLRELRIEGHYTQIQVAKAVNIEESAYQRYERGVTKDPRMSTLIAFADFFEVSLDYLVGRSDKK